MSRQVLVEYIKWLNNHRGYVSFLYDVTDRDDQAKQLLKWYEFMAAIPQLKANDSLLKEHIQRAYSRDEFIHKQVQESLRVSALKASPEQAFFITLGFTHEGWTIPKCVKLIERILKWDFIIAAKANFELFRKDEEGNIHKHPHVHFYIKTKVVKGTLLQKFWRPKFIQELVRQKQFLDIKEAQQYHKKYIILDKAPDKMECIKLDREWRKKNNIPDFEKNFDQLFI